MIDAGSLTRNKRTASYGARILRVSEAHGGASRALNGTWWGVASPKATGFCPETGRDRLRLCPAGASGWGRLRRTRPCRPTNHLAPLEGEKWDGVDVSSDLSSEALAKEDALAKAEAVPP